ncbi:Choline dehydrogenase or related flavoprotein [Pseudomonas syringae pv. actinidiae]|uniref:Choline dehydrogenase or related flavoprotein n=2 Tax=Pseudomonas syringae pv. actinidiae TaxID=103796 RepID=A0A2V0QMB9_PSESF|nr:Choline dehydrogenase or related flavoprotein [Pseudomonas syringae pv. actinidiae]
MQAVKSEAFSSPLNGGLMEKILQQAVPLLWPDLYPQLHQDLTCFTVAQSLHGQGGEA